MNARILLFLGLTGLLAAGIVVLRGAPERTLPAERANTWIGAVFESLVAQSRDAGFPQLSGPWALSLPDDHGGHPEARSETWSLVAHLEGDDGAPLGVQFSMARLGLAPPEKATGVSDTGLFRAHGIVIDGADESVTTEERFSRGFGAAGHDNTAGEIFLDDWTLSFEGDGTLRLSLQFRKADLPVALTLTPLKPANATSGVDNLRGFTLPRLGVNGKVGDAQVSGTAFLTHLWGDVPLPGAAVANDLLTLALDDGSELSILRTMRRDGRGAAVLDGALFRPAGEAVPISEASYAVMPPNDVGATWRIEGPELDLEATAVFPAHATDFFFGFETALMRISGSRGADTVSGLGTLQRGTAND